MSFSIETLSKDSFELGEGPHWVSSSGAVYFVDILGSTVGVLDPSTGESKILFKDPNGGAVSAVLPVNNEPNKFLISVDTSVYSVNVETGEKNLLDKLENTRVRLNDGKCDSKGRLWIGTMGLESTPGVVEPDAGSLYLLKSDKLVEMKANVSLSNGMCWSHDDSTMFHIDSVKRLIYAFDYDIQQGAIKSTRVLLDMNTAPVGQFSPNELPDGMTIDCLDNLWVAMFYGSRIINIDGRTGAILSTISMPTKCITSVCFGGPNLAEMYVTTCKKVLTDDERAVQPDAGKIFRITCPENPDFRGSKPNFCYNIEK